MASVVTMMLGSAVVNLLTFSGVIICFQRWEKIVTRKEKDMRAMEQLQAATQKKNRKIRLYK